LIVKKRMAVAGPGKGVRSTGYGVRQQLSGFKVLDPKRKYLAAIRID
jgi:hypothetical protein